MDDFKARFDKFAADAKAANTEVKDLDSFKAAFGAIGKNDCGGCHEKYRVKKSLEPGTAAAAGAVGMKNRLSQVAVVAAAVAIAGLAGFWFVTLPAIVTVSALPPHRANLANGQTMFNIGGCASCHATPNKDRDKIDRTRLGGGLLCRRRSALFTCLTSRRIRRTASANGARRISSPRYGREPRRGGIHLFPAFPLQLLSAHAA